MVEESENNDNALNQRNSVEQNSGKTNKSNMPVVIGSFLLLFIISAVVVWYIYSGKTDYEKGTNYLKEKKFTEALYEFQKVSPDNTQCLPTNST